MASPAVDFARSNQQRFLNELKDLLRIPSVSTLEEHKPDIKKAADYVAGELRRIGMENVEVIPTKGHPLIYADWLHASGKPTVLCYAHYDVQPAEPLDEWITPAFEPTVLSTTKASSGWRSKLSKPSCRRAAASCPSM
jgi:acetylornithine deacetylase/succinyl-diaminopimelate desuccinylase-like protein